jgi:heat-inducible transcriptional repressor
MTDRQAEILQAIVELYARTAEPVGSLAISEQFKYSSATIRAEMAALEQDGYIKQPHISAGRIPTDKGYRYYVNNVETAPSPTRVSRAIARRVQGAGEVDAQVKQATESLAEVTHNVGLATISGRLYVTGLANLFGQPEFFGGPAAYEVARLIDSLEEWTREFTGHPGRVSVLIGTENPIGKASGCSLIIARFSSPFSDRSYIGVLGSTRQRYGQVIGLVDYTSRLLEEALA